MAKRRAKNRQAPRLLGLGLDSQDGHKRVTQGEGFLLAGGSEETHERMTGTVIRTVEDLGRKGRTLAEAEAREVMDLLRKNAEKA
ncbi:MAG: hypothetical protein ACK5VI_04930 [Opitutia bacterium]|jgi:hypothetical protein